jgi:O-antigen/teichoic acid export membrane protein
VLERVKSLFRNLVIYGLGDVATQVVGLLLLPIFTSHLTTSDYGIITMLLTIEAVAKIVFRWGVDTAFMRLYYDCADQAARQRLASTIFFFLLAVNGSLVLLAIIAAEPLAQLVIGPTPPGGSSHGLLVGLTIANTFVAGFYFIPYHVLRIGERSRQFIALTFTRSAATILARLALVIWAEMGVLGVVVADVLVTVLFTGVLSRWFVPLIRPVFSLPVLREALGFGLPRQPHSVAQQVISVSDRYFLKAYGLGEVGLYSIGASFGLALKLFLSAFEFAWTPFFLAAMKEKDAPRIYGTVSTYIVATLVLLTAGLSTLAPAVVSLFTTPPFQPAAAVTPWIALGVMFQGLYLVGSIGLVITKRTTRYPVSTGIAAAASLIANILLIPTYGMLGAAWANVIAYATLAAVTSAFSWQVYPIPYEWSRLTRIFAAGVLSYLVAGWAVPPSMPSVAILLLRAAVLVPTYLAALYLMRFFHPRELQMLIELRRRVLARAPVAAAAATPVATDVEMAGDIVDAGPEVEVTPGSRARDR